MNIYSVSIYAVGEPINPIALPGTNAPGISEQGISKL